MKTKLLLLILWILSPKICKAIKRIIIIILLPLSVYSQKLNDYIPTMVFTFLSGTTDGLRDASMYRMDGKGSFWNGKQSWTNKYRNHDIRQGEAYFGSTSFLVWTTDAAHLSNMFTHQFEGMALVYVPQDNNKRFFHVLLKVAAYNTIRTIGHAIVYDLIFHPQGRD